MKKVKNDDKELAKKTHKEGTRERKREREKDSEVKP